MHKELQRTSELSTPSARTAAAGSWFGLAHAQEGAGCVEGRARSSLLPELSTSC